MRLVALALTALLAGCTALGGVTSTPQPMPDLTTDQATADGLKYQIMTPGSAGAAVARAGNKVSVHYTGWLTNGTQFDSSLTRGAPINFTLGAGEVIKGWDEGVAGMKVGEKRKLVIPGALGYGAAGTQGIPPNATLVFTVQLIGIN